MTQEPFALSEEIVNTFEKLFEDVRDRQFEIGDLLNTLIQVHEVSKAKVINYLAGNLRVSASTLYDYSRVSETWTPEYREIYQSLDWTIYRNTNPADSSDVELLEMCIDEGWNASKLKSAKYPQSEEDLTNSLLALVKRLKTSNFIRLQALGELITNLIDNFEKTG